MKTPLDIEELNYESVDSISLEKNYDAGFIFPACSTQVKSINRPEGSFMPEMIVHITSVVIKKRGDKECLVRVSSQRDIAKGMEGIVKKGFITDFNEGDAVFLTSFFVKNFIKSVYHHVIYNDNDSNLPWSESENNTSHKDYIKGLTTKIGDEYAFNRRRANFQKTETNYPDLKTEIYDDEGVTPMLFCGTRIRKKISGVYNTLFLFAFKSTVTGVPISDEDVKEVESKMMLDAKIFLESNERDNFKHWEIDSNQND